MPKAHIFNNHLNAEDNAAIEVAVRAAGYNPVYGVPANVSSVDPDTDVGVVGLPVKAEDEASVNAAMQLFAGAGTRVVCIWLRSDEDSGTGVPDGVGKYGSSTVDVNSPELTGTLKGESDVWEEPGGAPRPTPATKRNKC